MRYWAKATLSALPLMVMVLSRLAGASLSSQLEILIIAPESCLQKVMLLLCMGILVGTFIGKQSLHWRLVAAKSLLTGAVHKYWYCSSKCLTWSPPPWSRPCQWCSRWAHWAQSSHDSAAGWGSWPAQLEERGLKWWNFELLWLLFYGWWWIIDEQTYPQGL